MDLRINQNKPWTQEDFDTLAWMYEQRKELGEICIALGRSASGVCAQLTVRGYLFYSKNAGAYMRTEVYITNRGMVAIDKSMCGDE